MGAEGSNHGARGLWPQRGGWRKAGVPEGGAGIVKGRAGPQGVQGAWQEGISPGMLIFWSGGSRGLKMWFPSTVQSIKPVEITDFTVTPLPSLIMAFLMSFMQRK